jgi:dimethylhistidine N-methyltransferase
MSSTLRARLSTNASERRSETSQFLDDVLVGLAMSPKRIPSKYLYDRRGSELFDQICELPEYYPTRTELKITRHYARQIAAQIGPRAMLVELGSGSSVKTRIVLNHLQEPVAYVPVDISYEHLYHAARQLSLIYPRLTILPVHGDFAKQLDLPASQGERVRVVYFPGSTIGNFTPDEMHTVLLKIGTICQHHGGLLVGIDLQKDVATLEAAYNDRQGVTAEFNRNVLRRINRELAADFDVDAFDHSATYDACRHRIDIRLVSRRRQSVQIAGQRFDFELGEPILTEYSHKFTVDGFARLAMRAGFALQTHWTDPNRYFALLYLIRSS